MKAEQRKHLEQNELAARLSHWWKGDGEKKPSTAFWAILGVAALAVVLYFAWRYYAGASLKNRSEQWLQLDQAVESSALEEIIKTNKGTPTARAAQAQLARGKMQDGMSKLGSDLHRKAAIELIEQARGLYDELSKEAANEPVLLRESLMALAKAEEALVGVTKDNNQESIGSLDKALEMYQALAYKHGDTPQGKEAAERAKDIRANKQKILTFYQELNKRYAHVAAPKLPDFPQPDPPKPADPPKLGAPIEPPKKDAPKAESPKAGPSLKPIEIPKPVPMPEPKKEATKTEPIPAPKPKQP